MRGCECGMVCKWLSDDYDEICTNGDCPYCVGFCPVTEHPEICKFMDMYMVKTATPEKGN